MDAQDGMNNLMSRPLFTRRLFFGGAQEKLIEVQGHSWMFMIMWFRRPLTGLSTSGRRERVSERENESCHLLWQKRQVDISNEPCTVPLP